MKITNATVRPMRPREVPEYANDLRDEAVILRTVLESWPTQEVKRMAQRLRLPEADVLERHQLIPGLLRVYEGRF